MRLQPSRDHDELTNPRGVDPQAHAVHGQFGWHGMDLHRRNQVAEAKVLGQRDKTDDICRTKLFSNRAGGAELKYPGSDRL
jgi:hypothetical protein